MRISAVSLLLGVLLRLSPAPDKFYGTENKQNKKSTTNFMRNSVFALLYGVP